MNREEKDIICTFKSGTRYFLFLFWIMIPYTFINAIQVSSSMNVLNRLILFFLIAVCCIKPQARIHITKTELMFNVSMIYMSISCILSTVLHGYSFESIMREALYTFVPIVFFGIGMKEMWIKKYFFQVMITFFLIVALLGVPVFFRNMSVPLLEREYQYIRNHTVSPGFGSYIGVIGMGYLAQLCFSVLLFKLERNWMNGVIMVFTLIIAIYSLQRSPIVGIAVALVVYLISKDSISRRTRGCGIVAIAAAAFLALKTLNVDALIGLRMSDYFEVFKDSFSASTVLEERSFQMNLYNNSFTKWLFGEGVGSYSPNNPNAIQAISDSCYYRIINEQGIIGTILFFIPILSCIIKYIDNRNYFGIYFAIFSMFSFFFNRTIWSIPSAYLFYIILGMEFSSNDEK